MIIYKVHDLGKDFTPLDLNNNNDVVGQFSAQPSVILADGTVLALPQSVAHVKDISDNRIVLGYLGSGGPALIDIGSMSIGPLIIPGVPLLQANGLNNKGDLVGTVGGSMSVLDNWRGIILNRTTSAITFVFPMIPVPAGATPFLELQDLNSHGHAVGRQGWVRGFEQLEVPVFYDGTTVVSIGSPAFFCNGIRITENDRMRVVLSGPAISGDAIYDATTGTVTPFVGGWIIDLNKLGWILWEDKISDSYLSAGTTSKLDQLVPGSGWSKLSATHMNDIGSIIGYGSIAGESHGFMLTATLQPQIRETLVARILFGIINDAGGVFVLGGRRHPVPPWGPLRELLAALPESLSRELESAIAGTDFHGPAAADAFATRARLIVEQHLRHAR